MASNPNPGVENMIARANAALNEASELIAQHKCKRAWDAFEKANPILGALDVPGGTPRRVASAEQLRRIDLLIDHSHEVYANALRCRRWKRRR